MAPAPMTTWRTSLLAWSTSAAKHGPSRVSGAWKTCETRRSLKKCPGVRRATSRSWARCRRRTRAASPSIPTAASAATGCPSRVRFEVPGVSPESLSIETRGRTLQVRSAAPEGEEGVERRHEFARAFSLPADVDPERAEAECRLGVLTIRVPKAESEKPRRVEVKIH